MLVFPQLASGAAVQFPFEKTHQMRTVSSMLLSGASIQSVDPGVDRKRWDLRFEGITDEEMTKLSDLFEAVEGQLRSFTFLDPTDNLLLWSEDLNRSPWNRQGDLTLAPQEDPNGELLAWAITGSGRLTQQIDAPGGYVYSTSIFAKGLETAAVWLSLRSDQSESRQRMSLTPEWQRLQSVHRLDSTVEQVEVSIEAEGAGVVVWGPQLEAQPQASDYRPTRNQCGVYPTARFVQDGMEWYQNGPNDHSTRLSVTASVR